MYDEFLRPLSLRVTQFIVLQHLEARGETRLNDLAASIRLEQTTIVRSLRPLEEHGWIRSRPGHDRRERHVSITREGEQLLAKARPLWKRAQAHLRDRVSVATWDTLFRALPKVASAAAEATG
jgi:DNA-binding MarR family transcriptional regulator